MMKNRLIKNQCNNHHHHHRRMLIIFAKRNSYEKNPKQQQRKLSISILFNSKKKVFCFLFFFEKNVFRNQFTIQKKNYFSKKCKKINTIMMAINFFLYQIDFLFSLNNNKTNSSWNQITMKLREKKKPPIISWELSFLSIEFL